MGDNLEIRQSSKQTLVVSDGRPVLVYQDTSFSHKPYIKALHTPQGHNILLDSPDDHKHHHGLMLAYHVNGINFWEENEQSGVQQVLLRNSPGQRTNTGWTSTLQWHNAAQNQNLITEERRLSLWENNPTGARILTWQSMLQSLEGAAPVTLTGAHYHGLGLRFVRSMDQGGTFFNADNQPGTVFRGQERLVRSVWCAYTASVSGQPVTVAMFSHPRNPRPTTWFTMPVPFAYLSATMILHKDPLPIKPDAPLLLRYGVALWDGKVPAKEIAEAYSLWLKYQKTTTPEGQ